MWLNFSWQVDRTWNMVTSQTFFLTTWPQAPSLVSFICWFHIVVIFLKSHIYILYLFLLHVYFISIWGLILQKTKRVYLVKKKLLSGNFDIQKYWKLAWKNPHSLHAKSSLWISASMEAKEPKRFMSMIGISVLKSQSISPLSRSDRTYLGGTVVVSFFFTISWTDGTIIELCWLSPLASMADYSWKKKNVDNAKYFWANAYKKIMDLGVLLHVLQVGIGEVTTASFCMSGVFFAWDQVACN